MRKASTVFTRQRGSSIPPLQSAGRRNPHRGRPRFKRDWPHTGWLLLSSGGPSRQWLQLSAPPGTSPISIDALFSGM